MITLNLVRILIRKYKIHKTIPRLFFSKKTQYLFNEMFGDYTDKGVKQLEKERMKRLQKR